MISGDRLSVYILSVVSKKFTTLGYTINNINSYLTTQLASLSGLITTVQDDITTVEGVQTTLNTMFSEFNPKYNNFVQLWYGPRASDPTTDALGNAPIVGAQYYNTTNKVSMIYVGTSTNYPTGWRPYDAESAATAAANAASEAQAAINAINAYGLVYPAAGNANYVLTVNAAGTAYQARSPADTLALIKAAPVTSPDLQGTPLSQPVTSWSGRQIVTAADADGRYVMKSTGNTDYQTLQVGVRKSSGDPWFLYKDDQGGTHFVFCQPLGDYATNSYVNSTFISSAGSSTLTQITSGAVVTTSGIVQFTDKVGHVHQLQPYGNYATVQELTTEATTARTNENTLQTNINKKANLAGGNTFTGVQLVDSVSNWTTRQIVDAQSANTRFATLLASNKFVGSQQVQGSLRIISSDGVNSALLYSDNGTANGGQDLVLQTNGNYYVFRQNGTINSTSVGEVLFYNGSNRITVPGGTLAYLSDVTGTFNANSSNGYQILPSGLIMQWGYLGSTKGTFNFPITFPRAAFQVWITNTNSQGNNVDNVYAYIVNNAQFFAASKASNDGAIRNYPGAWLAFGY